MDEIKNKLGNMTPAELAAAALVLDKLGMSEESIAAYYALCEKCDGDTNADFYISTVDCKLRDIPRA